MKGFSQDGDGRTMMSSSSDLLLLLLLLLWDLSGKCGRNWEALPCCGIPSPHHLSLEVELEEVVTDRFVVSQGR